MSQNRNVIVEEEYVSENRNVIVEEEYANGGSCPQNVSPLLVDNHQYWFIIHIWCINCMYLMRYEFKEFHFTMRAFNARLSAVE